MNKIERGLLSIVRFVVGIILGIALPIFGSATGWFLGSVSGLGLGFTFGPARALALAGSFPGLLVGLATGLLVGPADGLKFGMILCLTFSVALGLVKVVQHRNTPKVEVKSEKSVLKTANPALRSAYEIALQKNNIS